MRVLVACEYSGRVREAFRARGHTAISCDFEPAEDNSPHHYQGDVFDLLENPHQHFDLMIAHPPCTYLCNSGVRWLYKDGKQQRGPNGGILYDVQRIREANAAIDFFKKLESAALAANPAMKIARENPIMHGMARGAIGPATQFIQPWWFGDPAFKATGLWLTNLPPLVEDPELTLRAIVPASGTPLHRKWSQVHQASPSPTRWKERSRTYPGFANAMAKQWG